MNSNSEEVLGVLNKIYGLLELLAEDKIAERDAKQRAALREIVGGSVPMQRSVLLMDGTRSQKNIIDETSAHKGQLSTVVGKLRAVKLVVGDVKAPKLTISVPLNFFDNDV